MWHSVQKDAKYLLNEYMKQLSILGEKNNRGNYLNIKLKEGYTVVYR